ncbi:MAG TPA: CrcB family protein [Opitutales bacterium]|nr:CrcB family protein [Opitutales bacterium]
MKTESEESNSKRFSAALSVGLGSGFGGIARFSLETALSPLFDTPFPFAILLVNVLGSFAIGIFAAITRLNLVGQYFLIAGFCGGFTTFSMFSLQTVDLVEAGNLTAAFGNIFATVCGGILAAWLGTGIGSIRNKS